MRLYPTNANRLLAAASAILALAGTASAASKVYTTDADFDGGSSFNVNHDSPNNDQLQLSEVLQGFSVLWIANAGEDTVSKIDTDLNKEVARYRTWFSIGNHNAWSGPAPSRSAVDASGNVYVANRGFNNYPATVMKILATGGIDRNGNNAIDTSSDANNSGGIEPAEIIPLVDSNANNMLDNAELADERVAWIATVPRLNSGSVARSLAIGPDGHLWVGLYGENRYFKMSSVDGSILAGPISVPNTPYGALVDANGILWGASLGNTLLRLDTTSLASTTYGHPGGNYGIALANGHVYLASAGSPWQDFSPGPNTFFNPNNGISALGVSAAANGDLFVSGSSGFPQGGASRVRADGSIVWTTLPPAGANGGGQRGAIPDSNGHVWTVNLANNNVAKYDGITGNWLLNVPVGYQPYTYSDASGSAFIQQNPTGTWSVVCDTEVENPECKIISWTADVPQGAQVIVEARWAATEAALSAATFTAVSNGDQVPVTGQFLEVKVTFLKASVDDPSPVLYDLTIADCNQPPVAVCRDLVLAADANCEGHATVTDFDGGSSDPDGNPITVTISPEGPYALGTTLVTLTVTDSHGVASTCTARVTVEDRTAPTVECTPTTNPSGGNVPKAGTNPASGQNPDGFYQLLASDNCDTAGLQIYVKDSAEGPCGGTFAAGPYAPGTKVKLTQSPGKQSVKPMAGVITAHINTKGDPVLVVTDAAGNQSCHICLLPRPPK